MTNMKIYDGDKIIQMVNLKLDDTIQPHKYSAHFIFTSFFNPFKMFGCSTLYMIFTK